MSKPRRVVWTKGMFLMPQHFQAQDEYIEYALHFRTEVSHFANWGFSRLAIDEARLVNGDLVLRYCEGIFPDGLFFHAPKVDDLPPECKVGTHLADPYKPHVDVYLAIPQASSSGATYNLNSSDTDARGSYRYIAEDCPTMDATLGSDEKKIQLARKSLRLMFDDESLDGFTTCHVARITRSPSRTFVLSQGFVPPLLDVATSDYLLNETRRLIEIMSEKAKARSLSTRPNTRGLADFTPSEAADFWYLHTLNTYLPELNHIWKVSRGHPEDLFRTLLRLAGALTTFALAESVNNLPEYDHSALGECFKALIERIILLLNVDRRENYILTPLRRVDEFTWIGQLNDDRQLDPAQLILSVGSTSPVDETISNVQRLVKVSSPDDKVRLVQNLLPGLPLHHTAPPPTVRLTTASQYFSIGTSGPLWENIRHGRSISVFVPGEIDDPKLELITMIR